jgi:carbamoyltransferase
MNTKPASGPCHILGISAFYHDSAACLLRDGEIVAAASEERLTRIKGDASFPGNAVEYCLSEAGISVSDLDFVGFYDKPLLKFERILETYIGVVPRGFRSFLMAGPLWIKEKLFMDREIRASLEYEGEVLYAEHHESHAASAFFPSPFEEAAILTMDGVGEWATASMGMGRGSDLELLKELHWPDSLGLLYSAFTYYTGFKVNSGEYKVMGLAPYGEPKYVNVILDELIDLKEDGSFTMNQQYFNYLTGLTMTNGRFDRLFGGPPRRPETRLTQREMDLARSVQEVCEEVMLRMARTVHRETGSRNLCMAGGVALNCVGNGRILREGPFENLWIQPAAGDAGGSLGIAQLIWHRHADEAPAAVRRPSHGGAALAMACPATLRLRTERSRAEGARRCGRGRGAQIHEFPRASQVRERTSEHLPFGSPRHAHAGEEAQVRCIAAVENVGRMEQERHREPMDPAHPVREATVGARE